MSDRRVVVTGAGTINALGTSVDEFWSNCLAGKTVVRPIPEHWKLYSDFNSIYWSPLPDIDYKAFGITGNEIRQSDPVSLLAAIAAGEAVKKSGIESEITDGKLNIQKLKGIDPYRGGVFIGTGQGGLNSALENDSFQILARPKKQFSSLLRDIDGQSHQSIEEVLNNLRHPMRANYFTVGMTMPNSSAANLGIKFSLKGANDTITAACSSGTIAVGKAYRAIREGSVDFALTGGAEYLYDEYGGIFRAFDLPKALATSTGAPDTVNRPFDEDRSGFLFAQGGAGILVLEEIDHARRRNAPILAEITGYDESFDAYNIMIPDPDGREIRTLIRKILEGAGVRPDQIDYINAHGTGTLRNDPIEALAIADVFGKKPVINSTKSLLGHTIGASGAIEAIVAVMSIQNDV
ncbi:MAG: beta-ketoacyl-[acyl-carrier-protein] synthase family protein, partial [Spirochaetales bacterium]|nr:beta-ketoacyl-[acyl-carrier-protein] synthase family protein [Spirochaetales bacterium]